MSFRPNLTFPLSQFSIFLSLQWHNLPLRFFLSLVALLISSTAPSSVAIKWERSQRFSPGTLLFSSSSAFSLGSLSYANPSQKSICHVWTCQGLHSVYPPGTSSGASLPQLLYLSHCFQWQHVAQHLPWHVDQNLNISLLTLAVSVLITFHFIDISVISPF